MVTTETPRRQEDEGGARSRRARAQVQQRRRRTTRTRYFAGGLVALLLALGGGGFLAFSHGTSNNSGNNSSASAATGNPATLPTLAPGAAVDGISCEAENVTYHIHVALTLYRDGRPVVLPAGIGHAIVGGQNGCLYWLHTHSFDNAAGIVHIESPTARIYTLGQFFDIWHYDAQWGAWNDDGSAIAVDGSFVHALRAAPAKNIHVYADGKPVSHYRAIGLTAHKLITIELGAPLRAPVTHVDFPAGE